MDAYSILESTASAHPDRTAVVDEQGELTYSGLLALANESRKRLEAIGVRPGMGVGLYSGNGRGFLVSLFALSGAGAVVVPIGPSGGAGGLIGICSELQLHALLAEGSNPGSRLVPAGDRPFGLSFLKRDPGEAFAPHIEGAAFVRPTSGTTGRSKGVVLSHRTILERIDNAQKALNLTPEDRVAWVLPMAYHFVVSMLLYVRAGAALIVCPNHLARTVAETSARQRCTLLYAAPLHYALLAGEESARLPAGLRLAICTSGMASPAVSEAFERAHGHPLRQVYGLIEVGLPIGNLCDPACPPASIGRPLPGFEVKLVDERGEECQDGEMGELLLKGPGMFDGYLSPAILREEIAPGGWFRSGDLARRSAGGSFEIVGRKKSMIITGGNKVFPEEVEHVINEHPAVSASRVAGKSHPLMGEVVTAEIVLRPEAKLDEDEIRSFCRSRLSPYKTPQEVRFVGSIALTGSGKVIRYEQ